MPSATAHGRTPLKAPGYRRRNDFGKLATRTDASLAKTSALLNLHLSEHDQACKHIEVRKYGLINMPAN
jgi:hypothetical protein